MKFGRHAAEITPLHLRKVSTLVQWVGQVTLPVVVLLVIWESLSLSLEIEELPGVKDVMHAIPVLLSNPADVMSMLASVKRMVIAYLLAVILIVPLGLAMGRSERLAQIVNPLTTMVYPIPKSALMPIIMLWVGIGDMSKILVIFMSVSLPILLHSYQGAAQVDEKIFWSARAMGMSAVARLIHVIFPASLPEILLGCRVALSMALITMISSEMIARQNGIGDLLFNSLDMAVYVDVYAIIVIIAIFGLLQDWLFERLRRKLLHWSDTLQDASNA